MKSVKAVSPYIHPEFLNFKTAPYEAWMKIGNKNGGGHGLVAKAHYPWRAFHGLVYRWELPSWSLFKSKKEARLRFVEPVSISFDTFPDYARHEIIPFIWDCWPKYFEKMCEWLQKHRVKTSILTSSQTAELMHERFPDMSIMFCPEAVDTTCYQEGKLLKERTIDLLEFGRESGLTLNGNSPTPALPHMEGETEKKSYNYVCTKVNGKFIYTNEQLYEAMGDAKITIALPRSITQPEVAGDIETLTQRYWENMLSRMVMVGHAPKELVDLIGYNPVIEIDREHVNEQIFDILSHIEDYQVLVDKNRETALRIGSWDYRIKQVMEWLKGHGYEV